MSDQLLAIGLSHQTAPLELRERLAFGERAAQRLEARLIGEDGAPAVAREAVVLSTCNRSELYLVCRDPLQAEGQVLALLSERGRIPPTELAGAVYTHRNCEVARHLFRVASGLESMVLGEAEIQGQVRRAYERALAAGHTGPLSNRLFTAALATGKQVRARTALGESQVSVPSVAVGLAANLLGGLRSKRTLIIGAGETAELTAEALARQGADTVFVANRHAARARSLAERFGGSVANWERLPQQLGAADIVLSSTSSPHQIVGAQELAVVMEERADRPLLLIDLAVPRDIDPDCASLEGVTLIDIDDLQGAVAENLASRQREVPKAELIIERELRRFARFLGEAEVLPTIRALREAADEVVEAVLRENEGRWETASPADLERVELIARTVTNRLLHRPTTALRELSGARRHATVAVVRELFGLDGREAEEAELGVVRTLRRRAR